jgi:hypothetical protein
MTYFISIIFCCSVHWSKQWANITPHTFCPGCFSSQIPSPLPTLSFGWLSCQIAEQRPPKAWAPPLSLFLKGSRFGAPSKGTSHGDREPTTGRLLWTHRLRFEGTAALKLEREGKAAGGWGCSSSCWLLCVVLCCGLWFEQVATILLVIRY